MTEQPSVDEYIDDLSAFVTASPSSFHAAAEGARRLQEYGFTALDERDDWSDLGPGRYLVVRDGALVAWVVPDGAVSTTGFRVIGAHTDSPGFMLKPHPDVGVLGWQQAGVEIYGGPLLNSWLDRELCFAGRVTTRDGAEHLIATGPVARIPQLAIHLDRTVNEGLALDRQTGVQPVWGAGDPGGLMDRLLRDSGIDPDDVAGWDIVVADTQPPRRFGGAEEFLASGRLDNLSAVHAGLRALIAAPSDGPVIPVLAAFDHEELGSQSRSGASGPLLADILERVTAGLGGDAVDLRRALAASLCLSVDAGHLVHPNQPGRHDPVNRPRPGGGPLLKVNANQRYATDAVGAAVWARTCAAAGMPWQDFVSHNGVPCGSTIGPLTATRLGIRTVDVGLGLLSMHSAREMCHVDDAVALGAAVTAYLTLPVD
ncbi:M18 family aminopeptidase [Tersicoccus sp. Bi-70]|uniref:M18 family aminopeptidase n=1 Tax=Tersicoccus sp. Bi-70 TaxID=1897634 RepID=UPI000976AD04|nr:M18 family aminopeptidase [Tersicoccus sp. Bi-70]OMH34173.1 M18 family aminopeptidase [Tersicoccus sp. Bi-70]